MHLTTGFLSPAVTSNLFLELSLRDLKLSHTADRWLDALKSLIDSPLSRLRNSARTSTARSQFSLNFSEDRADREARDFSHDISLATRDYRCIGAPSGSTRESRER